MKQCGVQMTGGVSDVTALFSVEQSSNREATQPLAFRTSYLHLLYTLERLVFRLYRSGLPVLSYSVLGRDLRTGLTIFSSSYTSTPWPVPPHQCLEKASLIPLCNNLCSPLQIPGINYEEINLNGAAFELAPLWRLKYTSLVRLLWLVTCGYREDAIIVCSAWR